MADDRGDLTIPDEFSSDPGGDGAVALVVTRDYLERVAVDSSGLIDLFGSELYALQILQSVSFLPWSRCADDIWIFGSRARREREQREIRYGPGQQLPLPPIRGLGVNRRTRSKRAPSRKWHPICP